MFDVERWRDEKGEGEETVDTRGDCCDFQKLESDVTRRRSPTPHKTEPPGPISKSISLQRLMRVLRDQTHLDNHLPLRVRPRRCLGAVHVLSNHQWATGAPPCPCLAHIALCACQLPHHPPCACMPPHRLPAPCALVFGLSSWTETTG